MRKIFLGLAAGVLGLALTGTADAHPGRHEHGRHGEAAYYRSHATRFRGGYYYAGHRDHWARRVWDGPHRRWLYWDPGLRVYFYWYAPGNCYYPVTYTP